MGPAAAPPEFRISGLGTHDGQNFDMLITSPDYTTIPGWAQYNDVYDYFGIIYMQKESKISLTFTIVKAGTNEPFPLPKFYFSFFDVDAGAEPSAPTVTPDGKHQQEKVTVGGFDRYILSKNTELAVTDEDGRKGFAATVHGTRADNPKDPMILTWLQKNRAVTFVFKNTATFPATYEVLPGGPYPGRDIYFAGKSELGTDECEDDDRRGGPPPPRPIKPVKNPPSLEELLPSGSLVEKFNYYKSIVMDHAKGMFVS